MFCFDGDEAGRKAARRALEEALPCMEDGRQARFLFLPEGEDPDTVVRSQGKEGFEHLLESALPLETFLFESVADGIDISSLDGKARFSKQALPFIRKLPEGVYRQLMFRELARRTGLELDSLMQLEAPPLPVEPAYTPEREPQSAPEYDEQPPPDYGMEQGANDSLPPDDNGPKQRAVLHTGSPGYANVAQTAIALLLHRPDIAKLAEVSVLAELEGEDIALLVELLTLLQKRPDSNTAMLLGHWYGTPEGELLGRLAGQERLIPTEGIEHEFVDTMSALARQPHRSKLDAQVDKLKVTNYADVSELEKQRLRELLQQKARQDAEQNRRKR